MYNRRRKEQVNGVRWRDSERGRREKKLFSRNNQSEETERERAKEKKKSDRRVHT